jgi:hypothetical protein
MVRTICLGGTASKVEIANVAHGLMFMTYIHFFPHFTEYLISIFFVMQMDA